METETVTGYVDHIIYRNAENGYTVLVLVVNEEELTCVGTFSDIAEGENIEAHGEYTEHATYGRQFKVVSFEEKEPEDEMAIERYLGSGAIHGIGLALAARIVRRFKKDTFRIIEEEPERLAEVKGISQRKAMEIADQVNAKRDLREAMIFLQQYGINMNLAVKIYNKYGGEIYSVLKENPYRMADDIDGVGFKTADEIAARVGIKTDSDFRIKSGIQYVLQQAAMDGHTYLPMEELTRRAVYLLGVESSQVEAHYMNLAMDRKIVMQLKDDITQIYANTFYYMEANTAAMLKQLDVTYDVPDIEIEAAIRNIEKKTEMELDEHQAEAVKEAVRNGLLVITGGPGTGKTTTINTIIKYFELEGMDIFLAAPTGRAAKRMSETTGYEARTIHRMLELNGGMDTGSTAGFERNERNPLETDVIIIDEMSMVDISLMYSLLKQLDVTYDVPDIEIEAAIRNIEKKTEMELDEHQAEAVKEAVRNGLLVITGGPGTGKTTTINTIIKYFELEGMDIFLAAPTGRAAKRMSETTGYEARTIHRMLELNGGMDTGSTAGFERNERNPLETDVIIIDEMSMVDISLMYSLLKAVVAGTRLILVGDVNQLPSVGPGSVLKDIIDSGAFHTVKLTKIFRQASTSDIIVNAHKINNGEEVSLDNKSMDFFFLKRYDADKIINVTLQLIKQKLPKFVNATEYDIQVLTPMRKGLLGVERLNGILQAYMNPADKSKREKEYRGTIFREGDKVMQIKNNYQIEWEIRTKFGLCVDKGMGIFNGDTGIIEEINDFAETMTISFDEGRKVEYPFKLLEELELAYAVTIHKSQGSEYPAVVIPLLSGPRMLMNRNLLYTAVTRAKKCVTIVGDEQTFYEMIQNNSQQRRYSGLRDRIVEETI